MNQKANTGKSSAISDDPRFDVRRIDAIAMANQRGHAHGEVPIVRLDRFVEGLPEQARPDGSGAGMVRWSVQGEQGKGTSRSGAVIGGQPLLQLHVQAAPVLVCQRCNAPFVYSVDSTVVLQLVASEDDLEDDLGDLDEQDEDFEAAARLPEKVVGSHRFDLLAQIEDELILSIPYVPRHEVCPGQEAVSDEEVESPEVKRPSPFAVLEQLKRKN